MSRKRGNVAEEKAAAYLTRNGFTLIERNVYSRFGEIDIIAMKEEVLHFIEVKSAPDYETAIANITPTKLSRLIKTIYVYLKKNALDVDFMLDAVVVTPDKIEIVENITL